MYVLGRNYLYSLKILRSSRVTWPSSLVILLSSYIPLLLHFLSLALFSYFNLSPSYFISFSSHPSVSYLYFCFLNVYLLLLFNCSFSFLSHLSHLLSSLLSRCSVRDKFVEVDLKPVCKHCYEHLPDDMKRRLAKRERDSKEKKKKPLIPICLWTSLSPFTSFPLFFLWSVSIFLSNLFALFSVFFLLFYCDCISNMLHATLFLKSLLAWKQETNRH